MILYPLTFKPVNQHLFHDNRYCFALLPEFYGHVQDLSRIGLPFRAFMVEPERDFFGQIIRVFTVLILKIVKGDYIFFKGFEFFVFDVLGHTEPLEIGVFSPFSGRVVFAS